MTAKLPKGIRWRGGDSLLVQVYRNGQRPSDTLRRNPDEADAAFIARARARRIEMEVELLSAAPDTPAPTAATQCWTLRQALERVRTTDKADGGWSGSRSVTDALRNAEHVLAYFGPDRTLDTIDAEHIREFRKALTDAGAKNTTANRKVAALSKLLTFAAERPRASGLAHRPKFPKQLDEKGSRRRSAPSPEQEVELLRTMRAQGEHAAADVVEVLFDTGMRVGEVWGIRPRHVDLAAGTLLLTGTNDDGTKNGEFRSIPLPARTERIVRARLSVTDKDAALFPYNYDWLRWRWDKARKVMGLMATATSSGTVPGTRSSRTASAAARTAPSSRSGSATRRPR